MCRYTNAPPTACHSYPPLLLLPPLYLSSLPCLLLPIMCSSRLVSFPPTRPTSLHFALVHQQPQKLCDHLGGPICPDPFLNLQYSAVSMGTIKWVKECVQVACIHLCISIKQQSIQSVFGPTLLRSPALPWMKEYQNMYWILFESCTERLV